MFVRIPIGFEQAAPAKIASELDHLLAWRRALGKGRRVGNTQQYGSDLGADHIALVERLGNDRETAPFRGHIEGQAALRAHLLGEIVAIARSPFVLAVPARSREHWNSADESAVLIAEDAAASARRQMKLMDQMSCPSISRLEHIMNRLEGPALFLKNRTKILQRI
ncbi:MAG TPA: hypothetical protein VKV96_06030 [Roseiarcus sp.]|nr:hypothetical protein [Roseiarcus sp.]